ncbi:hypothetical protein SKDZ_02G2950 [Saccharomyces kudriavzevii ZP591]|nr:hypothetical protein SKDZ_02G2950 [Saccharomyces kudriavzevii ZP591]
MPSLRDLALERNQKLNQLRARINQTSNLKKGEFGTSSYSEASDGSVSDLIHHNVKASNSLDTLGQEIIHSGKQKESQQSYIPLEISQQQRRIDRICETSDLKAKLAPAMEVLEKKTNEKIKGIIRKKILQESNRTETSP